MTKISRWPFNVVSLLLRPKMIDVFVQEHYMAFLLKLTWEDKDFLIRFRDSLRERIEESSVDSDDLAKLDKTFQLFVVARDEYLKEAHGDNTRLLINQPFQLLIHHQFHESDSPSRQNVMQAVIGRNANFPPVVSPCISQRKSRRILRPLSVVVFYSVTLGCASS
jgi:hypothetical protein